MALGLLWTDVDLDGGWLQVQRGLQRIDSKLVPPRTAMDIAGHSTIEMTMNVYGHVSLDEKREALDKVGELFEDES